VKDEEELEALLEDACRSSGVVGASAAVASSSGMLVASFGTTSIRDPHPVTPETKFRTGSICKVYTATLLVESLVDRGLPPDTRVTDLVPEFRLADGSEGEIRIQHLLSHSAGIDGDFWEDTFGQGDDAIALYVAELSTIGLMFPSGATWGYSNSGFVVAGRVVERLTGAPFRAALESFLLHHGLTETEIIHGPTPVGYANGHYRERDGLREARGVEESRALVPAGSGLFSTARDVAAFGRLLVRADSPVAAVGALLREPVVAMPPAGLEEPTHHGLGWKIYGWPKGQLVGHNGNGTGQFAWLRVDADTGTSIAVMVNTIPNGSGVWRSLAPRFWELIDAVPNPSVAAAEGGSSGPPVAGVYRMRGVTFNVAESGGGVIKISMRAFDEEPVETEARFADGWRYAMPGGWAIVFEPLGDDLFLHYGPFTARRDRQSPRSP
jgi:CubicO group peptidase (beta-lactamase class C family)